MKKKWGEYPMARKSEKQRRKENRSRGRGRDYVPFHKATEARSSGTAAIIFDPIAGRQVHTLSVGETDLFWLLRWRDDVVEIREQYEIPPAEINWLKRELNKNLGETIFRPTTAAMTTDFLVDLTDGSQIAISVKGSSVVITEKMTARQKKSYLKLLRRIYVEREYWTRRGVPFYVVAADQLNHMKSSNIQLIMHYYNPLWVITREHKLLYLIARKIIPADLDHQKFDIEKFLSGIDLDIDALYAKVRACYG